MLIDSWYPFRGALFPRARSRYTKCTWLYIGPEYISVLTEHGNFPRERERMREGGITAQVSDHKKEN